MLLPEEIIPVILNLIQDPGHKTNSLSNKEKLSSPGFRVKHGMTKQFPSSGTGFRIQVNYNPSMHGRIFQPCVYIVTNERNGTLYIGVTSDLVKRVYQHKNEYFEGFSKEYNTKILVYYEVHDTVDNAITREKQIKNWKRNWKKDLIETENPEWGDLYDEII